MRIRPSRYVAMVLVLAAALLPVTIALAYDWPVFDGGGEHTGNNNQESILNSSNVNTLVQKYQVSLPNTADGAPVYLSSVQVGANIIDILYVTTKNGFIVALNAHTGVTLWSHQYGPGTCQINGGGGAC